ncbi:G-protein coupled receptor 143-like isoform X3 [Oncorhynchus keta]|uniref:G-protein coupled receptor 143-like isoform X3 n=1 Tax=Oncorhynchus keta TaxID=8018 RepID=UPI0015FCBE09|nr:G-protein coupled receptor 143-like isoform X3 [Oncorhynchus keta]
MMASPRLETFCCPNRDASTEFVITFQPLFFGAICIGSATLSLIFSILQILPKRRGYGRLGQYPLPKPASSWRILFIISICDILGCADVDPAVLQCILLVDLLLCCGRLPGGQKICWNQGVAMLYYTSISSCENGLQHAIPHYITTYAPLMLVLIVNPTLFARTVSAVTALLKGQQGIYTKNERRLGTEIKIRFFKIMLVFFICWLPNIINESLLFYLEMQTDIKASDLKNIRNTALITWFIMGILNPMSGFLNTLAFHGWTGFDVDCSLQRRRELAWDSASTSAANNLIVGSTLLYQSHAQEAKNMTGKNIKGNGQTASDAISVLSEGSESSTIEIDISTEHQDYEDIDADGESLESSARH